VSNRGRFRPGQPALIQYYDPESGRPTRIVHFYSPIVVGGPLPGSRTRHGQATAGRSAVFGHQYEDGILTYEPRALMAIGPAYLAK
jgi:hypothetical protein